MRVVLMLTENDTVLFRANVSALRIVVIVDLMLAALLGLAIGSV